MNESLNKTGLTVLAVIIICVVVYFYLFRQQDIAMRFIPNEFSYCGKKIWDKDEEYKQIVLWLHQNRHGWTRTFLSYEPVQVYENPVFNISLLDEAVIVSYETDYGFPQYIKTIQHGFNMECVTDN